MVGVEPDFLGVPTPKRNFKMRSKDFLNNHQVIRYLFFGITTTVVGWVVYFGILLGGRTLTGIPVEDTSSATYLGVYTAAQIIQWIASVLVAFYTNKKWVFTDAKKDASTAKQLLVFAGGRVLTFFLDYGVTFFGAIALSSLLPMFNSFALLGREFNLNEIAAKFIAAVLVIIGNYFFSKILVFKKGDCTNDNHNS